MGWLSHVTTLVVESRLAIHLTKQALSGCLCKQFAEKHTFLSLQIHSLPITHVQDYRVRNYFNARVANIVLLQSSNSSSVMLCFIKFTLLQTNLTLLSS